jgi:uncharacterized protein
MSKNKIELEIIALSHSATQNHSYAVMLGEIGSVRKIPIVIGGYEAQAIAVALEKLEPTRPLTHDLMKNMMLIFGLELTEIFIYKMEEGIFFSKLICGSNDGKIEIDSRTSDALALAVRFGCPIFTTEKILNESSILIDDEISALLDETYETPNEEDILQSLNIEELNIKLNEVLESEDYIEAAKIRDEINKRKGL